MSRARAYDLQTLRDDAPTILVIEDDAWNLKLTTMQLTDAHYRCLPVRNIDIGWQAIERGDVDLVVSDLHIDALTLIERMRSTPQSATIPIIIASGETNPGIIRAALDAGATKYIIKPYILSELLTSITQCLADKLA